MKCTHCSRNTISGIHPAIIHRSVFELLPGKSYPPRTLRYAFSSKAGQSNWGLFRSTIWSIRLDFETGRRSSISTARKQPLKLNRKRYRPLGDRAGQPLRGSKGKTVLERMEEYPFSTRDVSAHKLATTEQSNAVSWTKSTCFAELIVGNMPSRSANHVGGGNALIDLAHSEKYSR